MVTWKMFLDIIYKAKIASNLRNYQERIYYGRTQVQFYILKRCPPTKRTGICYLCLNEKLFIIEHQGNDLLNQRNELISKCRHKIKFKLMNHKT